jgi:putative oxidoreductase
MIAARVLVAMMFLLNGLDIIGQSLAKHELAAYGAPAGLIPGLIIAARALQLIAGTCLILGIYPCVSALACCSS